MTTGGFTIRVDTREQTPLDFSPWCLSVRGTVPFYDYALDGDEGNFAVERKSLDDFVGSVVMQERLTRELAKRDRARQAGMAAAWYVVEADWCQLKTYQFSRFTSGRVHAGLLFRRWRELEVHHGIHVTFAHDPAEAAFATYLLLKSRHEQIQKAEQGHKE